MVPRVLHIVERLGRGATEGWLLKMLSHSRAQGEARHWSFYCVLPGLGEREDEAVALGANVLVSPVSVDHPLEFIRALRNEVIRGQYDVLHCHHDLLSGLYLLATLGLPIRRRIVHVHNAADTLPVGQHWKLRLYTPVMRWACLLLADAIVGVSNHTVDTFLSGRSRRLGRDSVLYSGVDLKPFTAVKSDKANFRTSLNVPHDARLLLFAGRIVPEKNPVFALEVLAAMCELDPFSYGVFAGAGSLESVVEQRASELGILEHTRMLGWRDDLAEVMVNCDLFILPSPEEPMEGFGLAVVEAQLAGLRLLLSNGIPDDPLLPTSVSRRLSLRDTPEQWAQAALQMLDESAPCHLAAQEALRKSPMDMDRALEGLQELYR